MTTIQETPVYKDGEHIGYVGVSQEGLLVRTPGHGWQPVRFPSFTVERAEWLRSALADQYYLERSYL